MGSILKLGFLAGIGVGGYFLYKYLQDAANRFTFSVTGVGKPTVSGADITIPLQVKYKNPTPATVNVDNVHADIYLLKDGQWVSAGVVNQAMTVNSGEGMQWIYPVVYVGKIFSGDWLKTASFIQQALATKTLKVRTDISGNYGGIPIPVQSVVQDVPLS